MHGDVFRRLPHKNKFVKQFKLVHVCVRCVVTEEQLKVPQNQFSSQNYVSNKIFTLLFIYCMQQRGLNLLQNQVNIFYGIDQFINTLHNFISLHLEEKSIRYDFFPSSQRCKLKPRSKTSAQWHCVGGFKSRRPKVNRYCIRHYVVSEYVMCIMVMECVIQYREMFYLVNRSCHTAVSAVMKKQEVSIQLSMLYRPNRSCHTAVRAVQTKQKLA